MYTQQTRECQKMNGAADRLDGSIPDCLIRWVPGQMESMCATECWTLLRGLCVCVRTDTISMAERIVGEHIFSDQSDFILQPRDLVPARLWSKNHVPLFSTLDSSLGVQHGGRNQHPEIELPHLILCFLLHPIPCGLYSSVSSHSLFSSRTPTSLLSCIPRIAAAGAS